MLSIGCETAKTAPRQDVHGAGIRGAEAGRNLTPVPSMDRVDAASAVMIGGAGTLSVTQTHPFDGALTDLVRTLCDRGRPLFGACWGHQFIARALGGTVVTDHDRREVGTHPVELTPAGRSDPLFDSMPPRFDAHMGHHDHVSKLPSGAIGLAVS